MRVRNLGFTLDFIWMHTEENDHLGSTDVVLRERLSEHYELFLLC